MYKKYLLLVFILLSINSFAQTYWRIQNERGEELLLTININSQNLTFEASSRKEAIKEIVGSLIYMMAKTTGKIKYPELAHGFGKISLNADTTYYNGTIDYPDNSFVLTAKSWKNNFWGSLKDTKGKSRIITGEKVNSDKPLRDYSAMIVNTFALIEKYFWDANLSKSSDWQSFRSEVFKHKSTIADDYELGLTMMWLGKKVMHIPHEIKKVNPNEVSNVAQKNSSLRIIGEKRAYLLLNNIPEGNEEVAQLFKEIQEKSIETLVFDLRLGRRNAPLPAVILLANHLTAKTSDWGVFLTQKWFEANQTIPKSADYTKALRSPSELSSLKNAIFNEKGFFMRLTPSTPQYKGKIYLLVDKMTSGVAEAFAIFMKNEKLATLVGQKTAGSPILSEIYELDKQYRITIPFAQFYDKNGKSYQGLGVDPDIVTDKPMEIVKNEK